MIDTTHTISNDRLQEAQQAICEKMIEVNREIRSTQADIDEHKANLKDAKETHGYWVEQLTLLVEGLEQVGKGQLPLPFGKTEDSGE